MDFVGWPAVPIPERPRKLYHMDKVERTVAQELADSGWELVDIRLLPSTTLEERSVAVLAYLEGVRVGSIEPSLGTLKFLEMEAKCCGILSGKQQGEAPKTMDTDDLDMLLSLGRDKEEWNSSG